MSRGSGLHPGFAGAMVPAWRTSVLRSISAFGLGALILVVARDVGGLRIPDIAGDVASQSTFIVATVLCALRAAWCDSERGAWLAFTLGSAAYGVGNGLLVFVYDGVPPASPSAADVAWLATYPAFFVGFALLLRDRLGHRRADLWIDGVIGGLAAGSLGAAVLLDVVLDGLGGAPAAVATSLAFPLGDIVLLAFLVTGMAGAGARPSPSSYVVGLGLLTLVGFDTLYVVGIANGTYASGVVYDFGWSLAFLTIGAAAWLPGAKRRSPAPGNLRLVAFPCAAAGLSLGVMVWGQLAGLNLVAVVLACGSLAMVLVRLVLTLRDIVGLAEARRLSLTDELTGIGNRRSFSALAEAALARAAATETPVAVLLLDLDHFKEINDTLGHPTGDELLRQLGPRLGEALRSDDVVARLGGDEFGVVLEGVGADGAREAAERIAGQLRRSFAINGLSLNVDASVGIALFPEHAGDIKGLVRLADTAMYRAKREGVAHAVWTPDAKERSDEQITLAGDLRRALAGDELALYYQPIADLASGRIQGVEALLRWRHPARGLLVPPAFLPAVEHTGLMREVTRWVLRTAVEQAARWAREGRTWSVAVNLSTTDLLDERLPAEIDALLAQYDLAPRFLELEVTESAVLRDPERACGTIERLRSRGLSVALDDFGTGFSSLTHLQRLPVDVLKLDRSFVAAMDHKGSSEAIVASMTQLAGALGMRVVAEGVEDLATLDRVRALGCGAVQGYLLARPLPADELEACAEAVEDRALPPWLVPG